MLKELPINHIKVASLKTQLCDFAKDPNTKLHLKINKILTDEELRQFGELIDEQSPISFHKLSLSVDRNTLSNPLFLEVLAKLNKTSITKVEFILVEEEIDKANILLTQIAESSSDELSELLTKIEITDQDITAVLHNLHDAMYPGIGNVINETIDVVIGAIAPQARKVIDEILALLGNTIVPHISYPITLCTQADHEIISTQKSLQAFQNTLFHNIQQKNKAGHPPVEAKEGRKEGRRVSDPTDPMAQELRLKALLRKKVTQNKHQDEENLSQYISLEVQHIEMVEQELEQQQECVGLQVNLAMQEIQVYQGPLLGFEEFSASKYRNIVWQQTGDHRDTDCLYELLKQELFANLPHAIKYVSPAAAEPLAFYLSTLVTLNKENLPNGFILKQTPKGEFILDYDAYLENEQANPFTPSLITHEWEPLCAIDLPEEQVRRWFNDEKLFNILCSSPDRTPQQLTNLYIKHGGEGVAAFVKEIKEATLAKPQLAEFLLQNYLVCLPQWDHLYGDQSFFDALERLSHYDEQKWACLQRFLQNTGSSRYSLPKAMAAFDVFWNELTIRCAEQNISPALINKANWSTPEGGCPEVYMERMLVILKNARHLPDQLGSLDGLILDNYGPYYASRFEDFTGVSALMALIHDAESQNKKPFNKDFKLYQINKSKLYDLYQSCKEHQDYLDYVYFADDDESENEYYLVSHQDPLPQPLNLQQLKEKGLVIPFSPEAFIPPYQFYVASPSGAMKLLLAEKPVDPETFYAACFRYLGMQTTGITVNALQSQFNNYKASFFYDTNVTRELYAILFLVAHERHRADAPVAPSLFGSFYDLRTHNLIADLIVLLTKLDKLDIRLSQEEGMMFLESIVGMNSCEFEQKKLNKAECLEKLAKQLEQNKFAVIKLFNHRFKNKEISPKWPFLYALDTAEFLAKDDDIVAAEYHDDLLLFSDLINSELQDVYYHAGFSAKRAKDKLKPVQHYLHQAAVQEKPNNLQYAIEAILGARKSFTYKQFLDACAEITKLAELDRNAVEKILVKHQFSTRRAFPTILVRDSADIKALLIELILALDAIQGNPKSEAAIEPCAARSLKELQDELQVRWQTSGTLLSTAGKLILNKILAAIKETTIQSAFGLPNAQDALKTIAKKIVDLSDFQDCSDFEKINRITFEVEKLAEDFRKILKNSYVAANEQAVSDLFAKVNFSKLDYETLSTVLGVFATMPQRNYLPLLQTIFADEQFIADKANMLKLCDMLLELKNNYFSIEYLDAFSKLYIENTKELNQSKQESIFQWVMARINPSPSDIAAVESHCLNRLINSMVQIYRKDNQDPILELLMLHPELGPAQILHVLMCCEEMTAHRKELSTFLNALIQTKKLDSFLEKMNAAKPNTQTKILAILGKEYALGQVNKKKDNNLDEYLTLTALLTALPTADLDQLHAFYEATPVSKECLLNALQGAKDQQNFQSFLATFEKEPFGHRDLTSQFSCSEVERVINESCDLLNKSTYTYQYRKQLMEAFLFVNEIGNTLAVYDGKAAKDLTNAEIKTYFTTLKEQQIPGLSPFAKQLLALGLMREAMYRHTGEFPYSTQVIALIDSMMHPGHFISNIDTGQGKSLMDYMKAALLWLDSHRVDLLTSSLVDAKRDIARYGTFWTALGIPYSSTPISSSSPYEAFSTHGIIPSTPEQLSLFMAKARFMGQELESPDAVISTVINESDYMILDSRDIRRFAVADGAGVGQGQEWIYYAINEFVARPEFITNDKNSAADDIFDLKAYLRVRASFLKKSEKIVDKFSEAQYLAWLESALMVKYQLKENTDYVIPDEFEKKIVNGTELYSKVVKILMKDGKISPDSTFGKGMQQLLYAYLNKQRGCTDFVIEPQNKTIISTNNKNLIDYYLSGKGIVWGSSGTVGSNAEIKEQYTKYGFDFSKLEPHQKDNVQYNKVLVAEDEHDQFDRLIDLLGLPRETAAPSLVFCKDIDTATRLFKALQANHPSKFPIQLYTGLGREEDYIQKAAMPNMITITTSALGRNTDIPYDREDGLRVWHTFIDSTRGHGQKSGRTGRQGSMGEVNYVLNKQEQHGKTEEQLRKEIDTLAAAERRVNEVLYNILGYLLSYVDKLPEEQFTQGKAVFWQEAWSQFSSEVETQFRANYRKVMDDSTSFMQKTLNSFNQLLATALKTPVAEVTLESLKQTVEFSHAKKTKYNVSQQDVKLADCIPPITIAYHLNLKFAQDELKPEEAKDAIKTYLGQLFAGISQGNFVEKSKDYLNFLLANSTTQQVFVQAHKEFLAAYLVKSSKRLSFIQRWLGYEGRLNQLASNQHYLLMFHAITSLPNASLVELKDIQQAVKTLLNGYLENSWFIGEDRKRWAVELQKSIDQATSIEQIISCLSAAQIAVAKDDIATNKTRFLKPLHFWGSRYQATLSQALQLATSLSGKAETNLVQELTPLLAEVTDKTSVEKVTVDELRHRKELSTKSDKYNAAVIIDALETALSIHHRKGPEGMIGRKGFFTTPRSLDNEGPNVSTNCSLDGGP